MIYVAGSLRSPLPGEVAEALRKEGHSVFDSWRAPGPDADDHWKAYEKSKGLTFLEALRGPAARQTFEFDKRWLDQADALVAVMPFGRSAMAECGYMKWYNRKPVYILLDEGRWDVMLQFFDRADKGGIYDNLDDLLVDIGYDLPTRFSF